MLVERLWLVVRHPESPDVLWTLVIAVREHNCCHEAPLSTKADNCPPRVRGLLVDLDNEVRIRTDQGFSLLSVRPSGPGKFHRR